MAITPQELKRRRSVRHKASIEKEYFKCKDTLDKIRSNITLLRWEVLSSAYKKGKEIWGNNFTVVRLANDMEMSETTVKRCLALDRATEKSWDLIRAGKISAFKLAMVCSLKSNSMQDEVVKEVIEKDLSTCKIKTFKPKNIQDLKEWKHKEAVRKGYSTSESAFRNFNGWIDRGKIFLLMPIKSVGEERKDDLLDNISKLHKNLGVYLKNNGKNL